MTADPSQQDRAAPPGRAMPPRTGSRLIVRLLTVVYALVVTPLAIELLSYGGTAWMRYYYSTGFSNPSLTEVLAGPAGMRIVLGLLSGALLLVSVVATGLASSAGLLAGGCPYVASQAARAAGSGDGVVVGGW